MIRVTTGLLLVFFLSFGINAQSALNLQGEPLEILTSSDRPELNGIFTHIRIASYPSQAFSFVLQQEDNRYLYSYDLSAKELNRIQPPGILAELDEDPADAGGSQAFLGYNDLLDWRPVLDNQGRHWFAFVSNSHQNNHDIYIGYLGGNEYVRLTTHEALDSHAKWSPDGSQLAFISSRSGKADIYLVENMSKVISAMNGRSAKLVQLTETDEEEMDLAWNPNPKAHLLAYAKREKFPGRKVETFQIRVMDLKNRDQQPFMVTDDPLRHYTRPSWDPFAGSKLLYVGQSILRGLAPNLYVSELRWNGDKQLENVVLEGYKTEAFRNVRLGTLPAQWLSGSQAILCQQDTRTEDYPLYVIDVARWLDKQEGAIQPFVNLESRFPSIQDFDVRKNNLVFVTRSGRTDKIYYTQIYGDYITPYKKPEYVLTNPGSGFNWGRGAWLGGGALVAGTAAFLLINGDEAGNQFDPIPLPPNHP